MANLYLIQFNFIYTYFSDVTASCIKKYKLKIQKYKIHLLKNTKPKTTKKRKITFDKKKVCNGQRSKSFRVGHRDYSWAIKQLDYELEISIYSIDEGAARVNYHVIEIGSA